MQCLVPWANPSPHLDRFIRFCKAHRQTHKHIQGPRNFGSNRPHPCTLCMRCGLKACNAVSAYMSCLVVRRRRRIVVELFEFADDVAVLVKLEFRMPVFGVDLTESPVLFGRRSAEQRIAFQDLRHTTSARLPMPRTTDQSHLINPNWKNCPAEYIQTDSPGNNNKPERSLIFSFLTSSTLLGLSLMSGFLSILLFMGVVGRGRGGSASPHFLRQGDASVTHSPTFLD